MKTPSPTRKLETSINILVLHIKWLEKEIEKGYITDPDLIKQVKVCRNAILGLNSNWRRFLFVLRQRFLREKNEVIPYE